MGLTARRAKTPRRPNRRGALLLVCLSLLVLFTVIAVTFVIVAGQFRRSSLPEARMERYGDDPKQQMEGAFGEIVRDTLSQTSAAAGHGLLTDMYGTDNVIGAIFVNPTTLAVGDQILDLSVYSTGTLSPFNGYYNGRVLTMLSGDARMKSTRIIGYSVTSTTSTVRVLAFENGAKPKKDDKFIINGRPFSGTGFGYKLSSGKLDAADGNSQPFALLPHKRFTLSDEQTFASGQSNISPSAYPNEDYDAADPQNMALAFVTPGAVSGAFIMPSFHRPDLINYWYNSLLSSSTVTWGSATPEQKWQTILQPYGPDWIRNSPDDGSTVSLPDRDTIASLKRKISLRPLRDDHPNFTGSNPAWTTGGTFPFVGVGSPYWEMVGPWDIDNDGDGVPDSIWIDLGFPVQTHADGRQFKPLFAILCVDLDGRLNVNAHGSLAHGLGTFIDTSAYTPMPVALPGLYADTTQAAPWKPTLRRGQGYGPADINLSPPSTVSSSVPFLPLTEYGQLLQGYSSGSVTINGRYGEANLLGSNIPKAGKTYTTGTKVDDSVFDALSLIKHNDYRIPSNFYNPTGYGQRSDLWGSGALGIDVRGTPLAANYYEGDDVLDNPYELNLANKALRGNLTFTATDAPFSVAELEAILRPYDFDATTLPTRLTALAPTLKQRRTLVTTESNDLPVPSMVAAWLAKGDDGVVGGGDDFKDIFPGQIASGIHLIDWFRYRLVRDPMYPAKTAVTALATVNNSLASIMAPELISGLQLDINRPFGNGRDDGPAFSAGVANGYGVVDEPLEPGESAWAGTTPAGFSGITIDPNNDGNSYPGFARQTFAKQLYCLMMLLKGSWTIDFDGNPANNNQETAAMLAQWAINVVDFRDRDSIITPFEYDITPFEDDAGTGTTWNVDGDISASSSDNIAAYRGLVWGCERPELLIGEVLAWHDRRTEDLATPSKTTTDTPPDNDFDQRLRPRGPFFVELYNPWVTSDSQADATAGNAGRSSSWEAAGEFCDIDTSTNVASGIQLNRTNSSGTPVWRLLVIRGAIGTDPTNPRERKDPNDPDPTKRPQLGASVVTNELERAVYFANPTGKVTGDAFIQYWTDLPVAPLLPGRYAVIGPTGTPNGAAYASTAGRAKVFTEGGSVSTTRRIELTPNASPAVHGVKVLSNGAAAAEPTTPDIQPAVAIVMNQSLPAGVNFSVTEPVGGYPTTGPSGETWNAASAGGEGAYTNPIDKPFDQARLDAGEMDAIALMTNGTTLNFRTVHLQRLANPLLPYNATTNPYMTIDSAFVNLTAFNGVTNTPEKRNVGGISVALPTLNTEFSSQQRGDQNPPNPPLIRNLWAHEVPDAVANITPPDSTGTHFFAFILQHSLGYLNTNYGTIAAGTAYDSSGPIGYAGAPKITAAAPNTFPWLTWNNRPFVGAHELLLVPKSRPGRLLHEISVAASGANPYAPAGLAAYPSSPSTAAPSTPFGDLLDFYKKKPATYTATNDWGYLFRVFDYVRVPSRFVGTETVLNPTSFTGVDFIDANSNGVLDAGEVLTGRSSLHPPFNKISNYREPGRVNINTIADKMVWDAIMGFQSDGVTVSSFSPNWSQLVDSRRGYGATTSGTVFDSTNPGIVSANSPSAFSNPFRSSGSGPLNLPTTPPVNREEIDVTLMRSVDVMTTGSVPLLNYSSTTKQYEHTDRNPYFRYSELQRLSNLVTTRSNVYAIWITMGYFEVTPAPLVDAKIYPDGYQLGQELGADTGEITRHRAFYIYDRSIPVGYERGKDLNIEKGILLKRFIE